jgi:hypothetical protein
MTQPQGGNHHVLLYEDNTGTKLTQDKVGHGEIGRPRGAGLSKPSLCISPLVRSTHVHQWVYLNSSCIFRWCLGNHQNFVFY